jgi:two-component system response regulator MprA
LVLVVEDDPDIRELMALVLRVRGWGVETAAGGREALMRLRCGLRPALIILDMLMPEMDGAQFLAAVRGDAQLARLSVVLLSGDPSALDRVVDLGVDGFLRKPVNVSDLVGVVARMCGAGPEVEPPP